MRVMELEREKNQSSLKLELEQLLKMNDMDPKLKELDQQLQRSKMDPGQKVRNVIARQCLKGNGMDPKLKELDLKLVALFEKMIK